MTNKIITFYCILLSLLIIQNKDQFWCYLILLNCFYFSRYNWDHLELLDTRDNLAQLDNNHVQRTVSRLCNTFLVLVDQKNRNAVREQFLDKIPIWILLGNVFLDRDNKFSLRSDKEVKPSEKLEAWRTKMSTGSTVKAGSVCSDWW